MKLFNTLSGKKEPLIKPKGRPLRLFVCGPTVYDDSHIGHARTYIVFDAFVKYLRSLHVKVVYLQNITDIDDKIIYRAQREGVTAHELGDRYDKAHLHDMRLLHVTAVDTYARATEYIEKIVDQVRALIEKGYAYEIPGDGWYFDIRKFPEYGRLARRTAAQADDAVTRIDENVKKRNRGDFALWKFSRDPDEPHWQSELGDGRPGWHIEDTAITAHHFGPQYELHGGGVDLKFPHHEAEIAQAEGASGRKPFVQIWMHTGMLTVRGEKMSKSLGNFITIRDFLKSFSPDVLRLMALSYHYRTPLDYTASLAESYAKSWQGILEFLGKLAAVRKHRRLTAHSKHTDTTRFTHAFSKALEDDFNTPKALASLFSFMSELQQKVWHLGPGSAEAVHGVFMSALKSLGFAPPPGGFRIPPKIAALAKEREKYRRSKQFTQSDDLRKRIYGLGYVVEDTPLGPFVWPSKM